MRASLSEATSLHRQASESRMFTVCPRFTPMIPLPGNWRLRAVSVDAAAVAGMQWR
jgi:hypothetical protein